MKSAQGLLLLKKLVEQLLRLMKVIAVVVVDGQDESGTLVGLSLSFSQSEVVISERSSRGEGGEPGWAQRRRQESSVFRRGTKQR